MRANPIFTPAAVPAAELDAATVGRSDVFDTLVRRIRAAARDGARPHTLLLGPRGSGKTHTLRVATHRAILGRGTANHVLPVMIPEDAFAIGNYLDLLVAAAGVIDAELGEVARAMRRDRDAVGIEAAILDAAAGRMILLAIENLDRVFDALGDTGQGSLRAWVETSTAVMVFATAPTLFPGVASRTMPWYGSFMVETLPALTVADTLSIVRLGARRRADTRLQDFLESSTGADRLAALHRILGGSPRPWQILAGVADVPTLDAVDPAVDIVLDQLAPHYQQRLWELPAGEQRLIVEVALGDGPRTVSDLAAAVGVSNQSAATALGRLTASHWVASTKSDTDRRSSWYDVNDPLLRLVLRHRR